MVCVLMLYIGGDMIDWIISQIVLKPSCTSYDYDRFSW